MNLKLIACTIWTIFVITSSLLSSSTIDKISFINIPHFDKIIHFIWYFGLYMLWYSYFITHKHRFISFSFRIILVSLIIFFGITIEFLQLFFTQDRKFEFLDVIFNTSGAIISMLFFFPIYQSKIFGRFL